ncbi:MAG: zinc ribbon domain-containing protein [Acidobacteriota bacterium]|jgi:putative FmdB family regulatory protein|nr:zinc ribbon domain-containing protein [Acidobacteriota bacterium]
MITYEYRCESCGHQFESRQRITDGFLEECPECHGRLSLVVSGGSGFVIKGGGDEVRSGSTGHCSFESTGKTCCGQSERCGKPPCGAAS